MEKLDAFSLFFSVFLTLAFVLFLAWFFLYWVGRVSPLGAASKYIRIIDRVVVDREKCILLVSAGDRLLLVAMSSGAVQTLCEFTPEQQSLYFSSHEPQQSFSTMIKQMMPRKGPKGGGEQ